MSSTSPRVWNKRDPNVPADAVYVGRPTKWGNPFVIGRDGTRTAVIARYTHYVHLKFQRAIEQDGVTLADEAKRELRGKDLVCWCAPLPCHADVLLEIANAD